MVSGADLTTGPDQAGALHSSRHHHLEERTESVRGERLLDHSDRLACKPTVRRTAVHTADASPRSSGTKRGLDAESSADGGGKHHPASAEPRAGGRQTYQGTFPPKLAQIRYGEPVLFRNHNGLPFSITQNGGFGRHTTSTHKHNAHHGAENDGFTGAFFFPGQFYDYHWPVVLAGFRTVNTAATDPNAGGPADNGGIIKVRGVWHETMRSHWFHDHMFSFTAENVYVGLSAMVNLYSAEDRDHELINDGINLG